MQTSFERPGPSFVNLCGVSGWDDDDVARAGGEALVAGPEGEVALDDDPGLVVGVAVQARPLAGPALVEDQRDGGAVVFAFEVPGREGAVLDQWYGCGLLPVARVVDEFPEVSVRVAEVAGVDAPGSVARRGHGGAGRFRAGEERVDVGSG